jgi:molybdopterin-containing oxidoreductase family membrane subunit
MWLPGDWKTFSPSPQDHLLFVGTIGMFLTLFLLFLRFLPCINIAEVKWTKLESDPHFEDNESHPDAGAEVIPAYQHELADK